MKETGFIKLYRSLNNNDILANDNNSFIVFVRLLTLVDRRTGSYTTGRKKLAVYMNMNDRTLYGVLKRLEAATMLQLKSNNHATTIYICNWNKWQQDDNTSATEAQTVRNTKQEREKEEELVTKVTTKAKTPSSDIDEMFTIWEQTTGLAIEGQKTKNRYAASNLLKKYGKDKLIQLIGGVKFAQETPYAPKIADFVELQAKQNKLLTWGQQQKTSYNRKVVSV